MLSVNEKNEIIEEFKKNAVANVQRNCSDVKLEDFMKNGQDDLVKTGIKKLMVNVQLAITSKYTIPNVTLRQNLSGENSVEAVNVSVAQAFSEKEKKFKFAKKVFAGNGDLVQALTDFFIDVFGKLLLDYLVDENLSEVNDVLSQAVDEAGLSYSVKVVSPVLLGVQKEIVEMSDAAIVFVADMDRVFKLEDILVLRDEDDLITDEKIQAAFTHEVEKLMEAQTPEQLVEIKGGYLVQYVCNISKLVKPMTLIRKITGLNVQSLNGNKDCVAYYAKDGVYALIARHDGEYEVMLSPFDEKTLRRVDLDVLKELEATA